MKTTFLAEPTLLLSDLYRAEILRTGQWKHPALEQPLTVTPQLLDALKANFDAGAKGHEVVLNREHNDEDACGWVKAVERQGNSLYAIFDVTEPDVKATVDNGTLKFTSAELDLSWEDPESGQTLAVLEGVALTHRPFIKRLEPTSALNLSEFETYGTPPNNYGGTNMATIPANLSISEELAQMRVELAETRANARRAEIKARLQSLARRGKITAPQYNAVTLLSEGLLQANGGSTTLFLSEAVTLPGGKRVRLADGENDDETQETDKLDAVDQLLDVLEQNPDAIASDDPDQVDLEEDDDPTKKDKATSLDAMAKAMCRETPALTYRQAVVLAEQRLKGGKR